MISFDNTNNKDKIDKGTFQRGSYLFKDGLT